MPTRSVPSAPAFQRRPAWTRPGPPSFRGTAPAYRGGDTLHCSRPVMKDTDGLPAHDTLKVARREFPPTPETAAAAREFVHDTLLTWGVPDPFDDVILLVSELVTNAVIHAESPLEVTVRRAEGSTEVMVTDSAPERAVQDRKSTRLNSSHVAISYAVFCLKKKI